MKVIRIINLRKVTQDDMKDCEPRDEYSEEELEAIYKKMSEKSPKTFQKLEAAIRNNMPYEYIARKILSYKGMPPNVKKAIALSLEWKYREIEKSIITN